MRKDGVTARAGRPAGPSGMPEPVAVCPAMREVREALTRAAPTDVAVLLYGETGVGKTLWATYLHAMSPRAAGPLAFVCVRTPEGLRALEAPEGLDAWRGGTVVLEGLDEAPPEAQTRILGVVEAWGAAPEGGTAPIRFLATACRDLHTLALEGRFRRDLLYWVGMFPVRIPPLRERYEDLPALVGHLFARHAPRMRFPGVPSAFLRAAAAYAWPGNVRELEAVVRAHLPARPDGPWRLPERLPHRGLGQGVEPFAEAKRRFEREYVIRLLALTGGNVSQAARLAGKARKDFYTLMARSRVDPEPFRRVCREGAGRQAG